MYSQIAHIVWYVFVVAVSVILAEIERGYTAYTEGDPTPKNAHRLNANIFSHIDIIGTILLPLILLVSQSGFVIGWARHIPINEHKLHHKKKSIKKIALAGLLVHICIAFLATILVRYMVMQGVYSGPLVVGFTTFAIVNYLLLLFNLLPVPPLDGAKLFLSSVPDKHHHTKKVLQFYAVPILLILVVLLWQYLFSTIDFLFKLIIGVHITPV